MFCKDKKILIIGLGLMGGSYAKVLIELGYHVGAITKDQKTIDYALKHHIITDGTIDVNKEYISSFDYVVFALYPKVLLQWVETYHSYFKKGALITDVTGIKCPIVYKLQDLFKEDDVEFIGSHPMAGREVYGVEHSDKHMFKNANFIITPTFSNSQDAISWCKELGGMLGFKNISILTPELHDEMIGFLSQLTHCIAVCLMTCKESHHLKDYTGDSFRDLTRIANINENMWSELFFMNKVELVKQMDLFIHDFEKLRNAISEEDEETTKAMMKVSTERRSYFNK